MKSHKAIAILSALALGLVGLASPAAASSMQLNETAEDSSPAPIQVDGGYEGTTVVEDPDLSSEVVARLDDYGVESDNVTSVQIPADGEGVLFVMDDNSWVLDTGPSQLYEVQEVEGEAPKVETTSLATARFSYVLCTGYFSTIRKVDNYLQWGAQSDCRATASSVYVHEVYVDLYDTCVGWGCVLLDHIFNKRGSEGAYSKVQTAVGTNRCQSGGGDRTYEQRVKVKVRSVDFGPFWDRDNVVRSCDVEIG